MINKVFHEKKLCEHRHVWLQATPTSTEYVCVHAFIYTLAQIKIMKLEHLKDDLLGLLISSKWTNVR